MSAPSVEYRGHTIRWSDNEDKWSCSDFDVSSPSLASIRRTIDDNYRRLRKSAALKCLRVSEYSSPFAVEATLIEYLGEKKAPSYRQSNKALHQVAAIMPTLGNNRPSRSKGDLNEFIADTPENAAVLAEATRISQEAKRLAEEARAMVAGIPRLSLADIEGLVKAHETPKEEGISDVE